VTCSIFISLCAPTLTDEMPTGRRRAKVSEAERLRRERQQKAASRPIGEETAQEAERRRWREARDASARRRFGR